MEPLKPESGDAVNPVGRDGHRRGHRETALETQKGPVVGGGGIGACALYRSDVAFCRIVVVNVGIVLKRRITDADTRPDNRLLRQAVRDSETRRKVVQVVDQAPIVGVAAHTADHQRVVRRNVVGKLAGKGRQAWRIEFPAQPEGHGQLFADLPCIGGVREEVPGPVSRERAAEVAAGAGRLGAVQQEAPHVVGPRSGAVRGRRRARGAVGERQLPAQFVWEVPNV